MKQNKQLEHKISANEINRYLYCPYQWYYKRHYGHKALQEKYKALGINSSQHENHYTKGTRHHARYHLQYQLRRVCQLIALLLIVALLLRMVLR